MSSNIYLQKQELGWISLLSYGLVTIALIFNILGPFALILSSGKEIVNNFREESLLHLISITMVFAKEEGIILGKICSYQIGRCTHGGKLPRGGTMLDHTWKLKFGATLEVSSWGGDWISLLKGLQHSDK